MKSAGVGGTKAAVSSFTIAQGGIFRQTVGVQLERECVRGPRVGESLARCERASESAPDEQKVEGEGEGGKREKRCSIIDAGTRSEPFSLANYEMRTSCGLRGIRKS